MARICGAVIWAGLTLLPVIALPGTVWAQEPVTAYPATFFASAQPYTALDMVERLPGFTLDAGDADVRGFGGASGNVLINGKRPTSKEDLEDILKRIPAASVERIDLVRAGAAGVDMQGRALVANVVSRQEAVTRGRIEAGLGAFDQGLAPRLALEGSRRSGDTVWEGSAVLAREIDDEGGEGTRNRVSATGTPIRTAAYRETEKDDGVTLTAGHQRALAGGKLRIDLSGAFERSKGHALETARFPRAEIQAVHETEDRLDAEQGAHYERPFGDLWTGEMLALNRLSRSQGRQEEAGGDERSVAETDLDSREIVGRALARRKVEGFTFEVGAEAAFNSLESQNSLTEDGVVVPLPSAQVRVEERRGELFATGTWQLGSRLTVEAAGRFEASRLSQSGDAALETSFSYFKPRGLAIWRPSEANEFRLQVERQVGQLNFEDFVSSASLASSTITAGNPDLRPEQLWRTSLSWSRTFGGGGSLVASLRHDQITDVLDRVLIVGPDFVFDAPGNIGSGVRDELEVEANVPLRSLLTGGLLKTSLLWRNSRVTDPATGAERPISDEPRFEGSLDLTQDLPRWRARWGVSAEFGQRQRQYLFDEIRTDDADARLDAFAEYRPTPAWNISLHAENLTDGRASQRRERYGGVRGAGALRDIEVRALNFGPSLTLKVQRSIGG